MFAWLSTRRSKKQTTELLSQAMTTLQESQKALQETAALCSRTVQLNIDLATKITEAETVKARLWMALGAPAELQPYIAAGCSESEARQLAKEAPRGA
jgi:hypothetical protein